MCLEHVTRDLFVSDGPHVGVAGGVPVARRRTPTAAFAAFAFDTPSAGSHNRRVTGRSSALCRGRRAGV